MVESLESRRLLTLSGVVYSDLNGNGTRDASDLLLPGIVITLKGAGTDNSLQPSQATTTAADGSYSFNVAPGTYTLTEMHPDGLNPVVPVAGSLGGNVSGNLISNIVVAANANGTGYDFREGSIADFKIGLEAFLASTPSDQQLLNNAITNSIVPPVVYSVTKTDADPSSASTIGFSVTFSKDVTGVDITDFATIASTGIAGASVASVTGSGASYKVIMNTGTGDGTLGLRVADNNSIVDSDGTPLGGDDTVNGTFISASYTITKAALSVTISTVTSPINTANRTNTSASGTGTAGATVSVVASNGSTSTGAKTATVGSNGAWSVTGIDVTSLGDGTITYTASASDTSGHTAQNTKTTTKDTVAPSVAVTAVTDPITSGNKTATTASGTGEVGATVSVVASDGTHSTAAKTATVGSDGKWSVTGIDVTSLNDGSVTYTATATDAAGNTATNSLTAPKDTSTPTNVAVTTVSSPINFANRTNVSASGTGSFGATITVVVTDGTHSTPAKTATVAADGTWSVTGIDVTSLTDGTVTFNVSSLDLDNHSSTASKTASKDTELPSVSILSFTNPVNAGNKTTASAGGTGEAGNTISLVVTNGSATTTAKTTTVASDGTWSITGIDVSSLPDGTIRYSVTSTDGAGNTANDFRDASKDATAPPVAISTATDPVKISNQHGATASGTGEIGATVSLTVTDGTTTTAAKTATVGANGTWSITGIDLSSLKDGTLTYKASITDNGGNTGQAEKTAVKASLTITTVTTPVNNTNVNSASASGTGEVGATISLVATDGTHTTAAKTATVLANGTWSITNIDLSTLSDGTITYNVTATDASNNTATASRTAAKDLINPLVDITTVTDPINNTNKASVSISGTTEANAAVSVVASSGGTSLPAKTATADGSGAWSITGIDVSTLPDGEILFTVTATDAANNTGTDTVTADKDVTPPALAFTTVTSPINNTNKTTVSASGTAEAGATITLKVGETQLGTTTADGQGNWTIPTLDVTALSDGTITFTATAADSAGNTATADKTATKDTAPPAVQVGTVTATIDTDNQEQTSASGTGEIGAQISLVASDGAQSTQPKTTTVGQDGTWSIADIDVSGLDDGTITYTATATDTAGNTATSSKTATKATVQITFVSDPINDASKANITVNGTGEPGATISLTVTDGTHEVGPFTKVVELNGTWSLTGIDVSTLDDGPITFDVTSTNAENHTATTSLATLKDTTPPDLDFETVTSLINETNQTAVNAKGHGEIGDEVTVTASDGVHQTEPATGVVDGTGHWSINVDVSTLTDGPIVFTASVTDLAENTVTATKNATKDVVPPAVLVTLVTDPINEDNEANVSASGTGEIDAAISLSVSDGTHSLVKTTTVDGTGHWSVSAIDLSTFDDGTIVFTATATDATGNTETNSLDAIKGTAPPAVPLPLVVTDEALAGEEFWT